MPLRSNPVNRVPGCSGPGTEFLSVRQNSPGVLEGQQGEHPAQAQGPRARFGFVSVWQRWEALHLTVDGCRAFLPAEENSLRVTCLWPEVWSLTGVSVSPAVLTELLLFDSVVVAPLCQWKQIYKSQVFSLSIRSSSALPSAALLRNLLLDFINISPCCSLVRCFPAGRCPTLMGVAFTSRGTD